jgi:hypothetical protein
VTRNNADFNSYSAGFSANKFQGLGSERPTHMSARNILRTYRIDEVGGSFERQQSNPEKVSRYLGGKYAAASEPTANGMSLVDHIKKHGIESLPPINIHHEPDNSAVVDGHHRLAVMMQHFPDHPIALHHTE